MTNIDQRIATAIETHPRIQEVITSEPKVLEILQLAAVQTCRSERWQMYEILKHVSSKYVGWYATNPAVKNTASYEMVMGALDILLPTPEIDDETFEDANREAALQQLRDAVARSFPQVQLPKPRQDDWNGDWSTLLDSVKSEGNE